MRARQALLWLTLSAAALPTAARTLYVSPSPGDIVPAGPVYRTISAALDTVRPGDVLVINRGVYRESIELVADDGRPRSGLTIQGEDRGSVVVKGSDVVLDWEKVGDGIYVRRNWSSEPQQVFVNGDSLQQLGGTVFGGYPEDRKGKLFKQYADRLWPGRLAPVAVAAMPDRSFMYERSTKALYVRLAGRQDANSETIEVSVRPFTLIVKGWDEVTVRNVTFQHSNTSTGGRNGAVSLWGRGHVLDKISILEADSVGLHLVGDDITVSDCDISKAGRLGVLARGRNHLYSGNTTNSNNTRGFNKFWEAGGVKFVGDGGLKDSTITRHLALRNNGDGIWFDWGNENNRIVDNIAAFNEGFGIHYEASMGATIIGNFAFGNLHRGIYLPHSSGSLVACNLAALNGMEGIVVVDEGRRTEKFDLAPHNNRIFGNVMAWNHRKQAARPALILPDADLSNISDWNLFVSEHPQALFSQGWPRLTRPVVRGLESWRRESGQDIHSWSEQAPLPDDIRRAYANMDEHVDWSMLRAIAAKYRITGQSDFAGIGCVIPGPFRLVDANPDRS